ncbi:MAG: class B sortase [Lachnospiraceae bacterium]
MAGKEYSVRGRSFRTARDYQAALRDQKKIQTIEKKYEMLDKGGRERLLEILKQGKIHFETLLGEDFLEELEHRFKAENRVDTRKKKPAIKKKKESKKKADKKTPKKLEDYDEDMQKQIRYEFYRQEKKRKRLVLVCSLIAFVCIGYVVFYYYLYAKNSAQYEYLASLKEEITEGEQKLKINYTSEEKKELVVLDKYKKLYSQNKSLIGWLKIDDTNIDYPVMQTVNNEYYLDHNYTQEYDKNGSIFLDKDCDITNPGTNMIIYGHHMKSGKMFGNLDKYSSKDYYQEHPLIQFDTLYEEGIWQIMYVFRSRVYNEDEIVFKYYQFLDAATPEEFDSTMQEMANISLYDTGVTATYGDRLITLSTCDHQEEEGRFVVVAKKVN